MKRRFGGNDDKASADDISRVVTRENTLDIVAQAHRLAMERKQE